MTIKYIIEKGSACVEAFRDVTHLVATFFSDSDTPRRSKELAFAEDMRVLVEDMEKHGIHRGTKARIVMAPTKPASGKGKKKKTKAKSAIVDIHVAGAEAWQHGKFTEYINATAYDPAVGYPITDVEKESTGLLNSGSVFDTNENPIDHDAYEDVYGDEGTGASWVTSLGGGEEFATGEIIM